MNTHEQNVVHPLHVGVVCALAALMMPHGASAECEPVWDTTLSDPGFEHETINALIVYDGDLIAGGTFTEAGGQTVNHIARWDGQNWNSLGSGLNGAVEAFLEYDGNLIVGGGFTEAGGAPAEHIAAWDGENWHAIGFGFNDAVFALEEYQGDIVAGGAFAFSGGMPVNFLARWNGIAWMPLQSGYALNGTVLALNAHSSGSIPDLFIGGTFTQVNSNSAYRIAFRLGIVSGVLPVPFLADAPDHDIVGFDGPVIAMTSYEDTFVAGGSFQGRVTTVENSPGSFAIPIDLARVQKYDGNFGMQSLIEADAPSPNAAVQSLNVLGGDLHAAGRFTLAENVEVNHVMRFDGSAWQPIGEGLGGVFNSAGYALAEYDEKFVVAGRFTTAGGEEAFSIASWTVPEPVSVADFNCDDVVDLFDLLILIAAWGECDDPDDCLADINGPENEPDGVVDVHDLLKLIVNWG